MSIVSLEEKRLKQLRQQLFGKEQTAARIVPAAGSRDTNTLQIDRQTQSTKQINAQTSIINPISLRKDFIKIILLSFLALSIQIGLFIASRNGLINFFN